MDFFDNPYFILNKKLLSAVGQWPFQPGSLKFFIRCLVFIAFVSLIIPQTICYYKLWGDSLDRTLERTLPGLTTVIYGLKGLNYVFNEHKVKKLLIAVKRDWEVLSSEPEFGVLQLYAKQGRKSTISYSVYLATTTVIYLLPPMIPYILDKIAPRNETRARKFIYEADYGLEDNEKYFFWIMLHDYISAYAKIATSLASDTMFMVFTQHACAVFSCLGQKLEKICNGVHSAKDIMPEEERRIYEEISLCVDRHKNVIQFATDLEDSFALSYLVQIGITVIIISLIGLEVLLNLDKPHEALRFILFLFGHMYSLFFISLPSQRLMDHSVLLIDHAYSSKWYAMSIRCRRLLIMIMMRSIEPCKLTAGKIYVLNMESYSAVLRASMSYFTMLTSMR